jgi:hypothetical protein
MDEAGNGFCFDKISRQVCDFIGNLYASYFFSVDLLLVGMQFYFAYAS